MAHASKNIIQRQVLDATVWKKDNAYEVQNELSMLCQTKIMKALDEVCLDLSGSDEYIKLDRISVDLGHITRSDLEDEFSEKAKRALYDELSSEIMNIRQWPDMMDEDGVLSEGYSREPSPGSESGGRILSQMAYYQEVLEFYLKTGVLPWWAEKDSQESMEHVVRGLLAEHPDKMRTFFARTLRNSAAGKRFVYQFRDSIYSNVTKLFSPLQSPEQRAFFNDMKEVIREMDVFSIPNKELEGIVSVELELLDDGGGTIELHLQRIFRNLTSERIVDMDYPELLSELMQTIQRLHKKQYAFRSSLPDLICRLMKPPDSEERDEVLQEDESPGDTGDNNRAYEIRQHFLQLSDAGDSMDGCPVQGLPGGSVDQNEEPALQSIYIENAGLILIWPYLGTFLKKIGLLKDGNFTGVISIMKAMHVLHYLVTGETGAPEHVLALNKLLCNWPLSKPVLKLIDLSQESKSEAVRLIRSVIANWKALKNTSVEGFRSSFLQREGVLIKNEHNWLLRVERRSYDMLLDSLPWGISMIRLSWMNTTIYVEW
jgi:hypothetical protein